MTRKLPMLLLGLALAASAMAPGFARVQLAQQVADQLRELGVDGTLVMTQDQLLQIETVLNSEEQDDEKKKQIDMILAK